MSKRKYRFGLAYVLGDEKAVKTVLRLLAELGFKPSVEPMKKDTK